MEALSVLLLGQVPLGQVARFLCALGVLQLEKEATSCPLLVVLRLVLVAHCPWSVAAASFSLEAYYLHLGRAERLDRLATSC